MSRNNHSTSMRGHWNLSLPAVLMLMAVLLGSFAGTAQVQASDRAKVLIAFSRQPGPAEQALVRGFGGDVRYTYSLVPAIAATVPAVALDGLRHNPRVVAIEPDLEVYLVDAELDNAWGVKRIGAGAVHAQGNLGAGVKVGILDTGIDLDHPDLAYDPSCSASFVEGETLDDGHSHGTHVAGTVAGLDNDSGVVGVAPEVTLCIYKVFSNSGASDWSDIIAALDQAVTDGVQITNNSYGDSADPGAIVKTAFDNAQAAGVLHVAASGNYGNFFGTGENCIYPARWDTVIATAATTESDTRAYYSSTCPEVELAAPGHQIYSTMPGGGYGYKNGTSMASPHVAGTAALILAANPGWSNNEARTRLQTTADDLGDVGRDPWYGYGLVDADEAAATPNNPPVADDQEVVTDEDTPVAITLTASDPDGDPLTYSVVTDPNNGTLTGTAPDLTYTPASNYNGPDSFTFMANDGQVDSNIATVSITVWPVNDPPNATFIYNCTALSCDFDASGSSDPEEAIASYDWDFGDGNTGSGMAPSHGYAVGGTYSVAVTVTDDGGASDTDVQTVTVSEASPSMHVGDLDGTLATANRNFWWAEVTITVHDRDENPVPEATVQGTWSGGASGSGTCLTSTDGTCAVLSPKIASAQETILFVVDSVAHATLPYQPAENHDPDGDSDGTSILVSQAGNQSPVAYFTYDCSELACTFDGSGSSDPDGIIISYEWDFGDGGTATGASASHTYAAAGTYTVILTVTDDEGAADTETQNVPVGVSPGTMFVFDISMSGKAAGPNRSATAVVTIYDTGNMPVAGATVYGTWSGDYSASMSGVTAADGTVAFSSGKVRHANATFTFTVDDVFRDGFTYEPGLNNQSSATLVVP